MAECELVANCPIFLDKMEKKPGLTEMYKQRCCRTDNSNCARYLVSKSLGRERVPQSLYPNQMAAAHEIISEVMSILLKR